VTTVTHLSLLSITVQEKIAIEGILFEFLEHPGFEGLPDITHQLDDIPMPAISNRAFSGTIFLSLRQGIGALGLSLSPDP
jgi:hypothetical protein